MYVTSGSLLATNQAEGGTAIAPPPPLVSVVIPSIGRPHLARTIAGARSAARAAGFAYEIVVVDDSPDGAAMPICSEAEDGSGDLNVVVSRSRNIATARNAGLAAGRGMWLAFIDDDEWPEPDWLCRNLAVAEKCGADAVIGPVRAHYPATAPRWIVAGDPYSRWWLKPMMPLQQGSTANALVRRGALSDRGLFFDERFGRSGGEDSDLFSRLATSGGRIVSGDGVVHEEVSQQRCSMRDLARRAFRVGQTYALTRSLSTTGMQRIRLLATSSVKVVIYSSGAGVLLPFRPRRAMGAWLNALRNAGKIGLLAGQPLVSYYARREPTGTAAVMALDGAIAAAPPPAGV
jgi:succinoglycan biosynthesis protein ExoM